MIRSHNFCAVLVATTFACGTESIDDTGSTEQLASVHLKGGRNAEPSFTDHGLYLSAAGALSGLGNGDVVIELVAQANVDATCGNPGSGAHQAPGQNPAPLTVTGVQEIPEEEIKNGTLRFDVATLAPASQIAGAPDCPNSSWVEVIQDLAFTSATITVEQPEFTVVLTVSCTFTPATSDGSVSAGTVSCTSS